MEKAILRHQDNSVDILAFLTLSDPAYTALVRVSVLNLPRFYWFPFIPEEVGLTGNLWLAGSY